MESSQDIEKTHLRVAQPTPNNVVANTIPGNPTNFHINNIDEAFLDDFTDFPYYMSLPNGDGRSLSSSIEVDPDIFGYMRQPQQSNDNGQYEYNYTSSTDRQTRSSGYQSYQSYASVEGNGTSRQTSLQGKRQAAASERQSHNDAKSMGSSVTGKASSGQSIGSHSDNSSNNSGRSRVNVDPNDPKKKVADKKRQDRNSREQQRSFKISKQIDQLKQLLEESGFKVKNSKYDILSGVTAYVKQLQARSSDIQNDIRSVDQHIVNKSANIIPQDPTIPSQPRPRPVESLPTVYPGSSSSGRYPDPFKPIASSFSDRNFRLYFTQSPMALALAATDGRIFECNQAFQDITGLQKEHVLHASIFKLVDPNYLQEAYINIGLLLQPTAALAANQNRTEPTAVEYTSVSDDPQLTGPSPGDQQSSYPKPEPHSSTSTSMSLKRSRSSMEESQSPSASAPDVSSRDILNISSTKSFYVKSLIISAYDGKHLNMAIGVLMPERNSHLRQNSFYPTSLQQSCFSVALVPGDLEQ